MTKSRPPYYTMACAIVGGLLYSTFVSLVLLQTIYTGLDVIRHWPRKFFSRVARHLRGRKPQTEAA